MCRQVEEPIKFCDACQHHKPQERINMVRCFWNLCSFEKVHMDCDGSWTVCIQSDVTRELSDFKTHILTMADMATNWQELSFIPTAKYRSCTKQFNLCWLCLFPCLNTVRHHNTSSNKLPKRIGWHSNCDSLKKTFLILHHTHTDAQQAFSPPNFVSTRSSCNMI